jgi:hypothetical protein
VQRRQLELASRTQVMPGHELGLDALPRAQLDLGLADFAADPHVAVLGELLEVAAAVLWSVDREELVEALPRLIRADAELEQIELGIRIAGHGLVGDGKRKTAEQ